MLECYYVILVIVLMYFIYINCKSDEDTDSDEDGFRSNSGLPIILGRGIGVTPRTMIDYKCPSTHPNFTLLNRCRGRSWFSKRVDAIKTQKNLHYNNSKGNKIPSPEGGKYGWEKCGLLYYPKCPHGYETVGCNICKLRPSTTSVSPRPSTTSVSPRPSPVAVAIRPSTTSVSPRPSPVAVAIRPSPAAVAIRPSPAAVTGGGNLNTIEQIAFKKLVNKLGNRTLDPIEAMNLLELANKKRNIPSNVCVSHNKNFIPSRHCFSVKCKGNACADYEPENIKLNIPKDNKIRECITGDEEECYKLPCYGDLSKCIEKNDKIKISPRERDDILYLHKLLNEYRKEKKSKHAKLIVNLPGWKKKRRKQGLKWARRRMVPYKEYT